MILRSWLEVTKQQHDPRNWYFKIMEHLMIQGANFIDSCSCIHVLHSYFGFLFHVWGKITEKTAYNIVSGNEASLMYNITSQRSPSGYFTFVVIAGFRQMKILNKETTDLKFLTHKEHKMQKRPLRDILQKEPFSENLF